MIGNIVMAELFNAVFYSFWTWLGTLILVTCAMGSLGAVIAAFRSRD